jgi:Kef-type K+ transport system membrane component KefB
MIPIVTAAIDVPDFVYTTTGNDLLIVVHLVAFVIAAYFAAKAFGNPQGKLFGWGFTLYALAEISYILYHVSITSIMLSHIVSEVLDLVAFILVFAGLAQNVLSTRKASAVSSRVEAVR